MSGSDALLWALERSDPRLRSTIAILLTFDRAPSAGAVRRRLEVLAGLPRFGDVVRGAPAALAQPCWEPAREVDFGYHLRAVGAPGKGCPEDLLELAAGLASEPLDPARPLWQVTVVGERAAVMRLHHSLTDGLGAVSLALALFDLERDPPRCNSGEGATGQAGVHESGYLHPGSPHLSGAYSRSGPSELLMAVATEVGSSARLALRALPWVTGSLKDMLADPGPRAGAVLELARSIAELAAPSVAPLSELLSGRSLGVRLAWLDLPLDELRRAGKAAGCSVNDAYLAGLLRGFSLYHARMGCDQRCLRVAVPVSTRGSREIGGLGGSGNHVMPLRLRLPLRLVDPLERMRLIHDLIGRYRATPAVGAVEPLAEIACRVPALRSVIGASAQSVDLVASDVPGSEIPFYLGGAKVEQIVAFGPRMGAAVNATLLSYEGRARVGLNVDPAAVSDAGQLAAALEDGFSEVLDAG